MSSRSLVAIVAVLLLTVGGVAAYDLGYLAGGEYERTTVTVVEEGTCDTLAAVDARVADTFEKRYTGLSDTESLDADEGMLFVHDSEGQRAYVMREMAFPIDIVFVDANGTITAIHHAPVEDGSDGQLTRYEGTGKYVLEVPYNYTRDNGIEVGDHVRVDE
ncbi:hypothetical protein SAMN04487948_12153 [Halogranum amylolyticum]|uniref:DUF192 domain-containing protein n=1 Tax=Halogranum amylolyticum TaxID=660520 RepID=A0A1H8VZ91_9EURY|nr:DUF192 domain-containing protein [Halogranum amylolyticum]SEP20732.1 hypothetical protein SAMN04487948_12153 [Halogranum amylolyticum]